MKTITEYRPLIFGELFAQSEKRRSYLRRFTRNGVAVACYCIFGLWFSMDTGLAPWNWQFWMVFGPIFVAGELANRELCIRRCARKAALGY